MVVGVVEIVEPEEFGVDCLVATDPLPAWVETAGWVVVEVTAGIVVEAGVLMMADAPRKTRAETATPPVTAKAALVAEEP